MSLVLVSPSSTFFSPCPCEIFTTLKPLHHEYSSPLRASSHFSVFLPLWPLKKLQMKHTNLKRRKDTHVREEYMFCLPGLQIKHKFFFMLFLLKITSKYLVEIYNKKSLPIFSVCVCVCTFVCVSRSLKKYKDIE